jgi:hypothetical protein
MAGFQVLFVAAFNMITEAENTCHRIRVRGDLPDLPDLPIAGIFVRKPRAPGGLNVRADRLRRGWRW